jgi:hypothetical protein
MFWADAMATPANSAAVLSNSCLLIQRSFRVSREFPGAAEFSRFLGLPKKTNPPEQGSRIARAWCARFLRMFHVHRRFRFLAGAFRFFAARSESPKDARAATGTKAHSADVNRRPR